MSEELKTCPFCSCTDIGEVTINHRLEPRHRRFKVYCKVCQCRTSEHKTRKEARIYWNTRTLPQPAAVEAVGEVHAMSNGMQYAALYTMAGQHLVGAKLYTHQADQVADCVVVSRELLERLASPQSEYALFDAQEELLSLLAKP